MKLWLGILLAAAAACSMGLAERVPAPVVPPITHEGIVSNAEGDGQTARLLLQMLPAGFGDT